jgi:hypothetical protein
VSLPSVPVEFVLFAFTLLGVAVLHSRALEVAATGLGAIALYKLLATGFDGVAGLPGLMAHLGREWAILANLGLLLLGFTLLSRHFEESHVPRRLPDLLPDDWRGAFLLLVLVFVLSSFLDNIAAALIGGTVAKSVFRDRVHVGYVAALVATVAYFQMFNGRNDIWMSAVMGACQVAIFGGFAIYLPELFPTRLRSTGTSFCYNVGRFIAATGPFTMGSLQAALKATATTPEAKLEAFRTACSAMSVVFLLGLIAIAMLPETKGRPRPE